MRVAKAITISDSQRKTLAKWARGRSTPARLMLRAKIVLAAAAGKLNQEIAAELKTGMKTVCLWRNCFAQSGLAGIERDAPRGGRPPVTRNEVATEIVRVTTTEQPHAATHWSTRTLATHLNVSPSMVQRVWKANRLQPHRTKTFKLSNDPQFAEKVVDIVGLYMNPPEHALVLCVDEKSQIQALDRTQKGLPIHPGRLGTMTHDYKRHGTTTLFAALIVSDGLVIEACMKRHRHQEWLKFLKQIDASTDPDLDLHLVVDNYATHKHPKVRRWLAKHPRFHMHFTPTSSSWLNLVERWFREITQKRLRRGTFRSVRALIEAIVECVEAHNEQAQGMFWKALPDDILAKVRRARAVLDKTPTA
ncbi:MAG TPA: IS630 family transposase [Pirellulaceae bacterium]|nr:IS630 family transposase [Pirellulaceae bacterium]